MTQSKTAQRHAGFRHPDSLDTSPDSAPFAFYDFTLDTLVVMSSVSGRISSSSHGELLLFGAEGSGTGDKVVGFELNDVRKQYRRRKNCFSDQRVDVRKFLDAIKSEHPELSRHVQKAQDLIAGIIDPTVLCV